MYVLLEKQGIGVFYEGGGGKTWNTWLDGKAHCYAAAYFLI